MIVTLANKSDKVIQQYESLFNNVTELLNNWELSDSGVLSLKEEDSRPTPDSIDYIHIANLQSYFSHLSEIVSFASATIKEENIKDYNNKFFSWQYYTMLPLDEELFEVNADTRKITVPASMKSVGVVGDSYVETVFFKINRYFDIIDFAAEDMVPYIEWKRGSVSDISPAYTVEFLRDTDYILVGWTLTDEILEEAGTLEFALRFVRENADKEILYSYSTLSASVNVVKTLNYYQAGDTVEGVGDGEDSLRNAILSRITSRVVAPDAFGSSNMPHWVNDDGTPSNIEQNENVVLYTKVADSYYADIDDEGKLSIYLNAKLRNGANDGYARYTWNKINNGTSLTVINEGSETKDGDAYIGYTYTFENPEVGRYRCTVTEEVGGIIRAKADSQNLYILGPEAPKVKTVTTEWAEKGYIPTIISDGSTGAKIEILPADNYPKFYDNTYDQNEATKVTYTWETRANPQGEWTLIDNATEKAYTTIVEGYYQGCVQTERNGTVYSEKVPGTQYYVTYPATIPNNNSYEIIGKDEELEISGITSPNDKQGYLGETIIIKFVDDYKFDRIRYQWYQYNATSKKKLTPVTDAYGETSERQISFKPKTSGVYVVAIQAQRNEISWAPSAAVDNKIEELNINEEGYMNLDEINSIATLLPRTDKDDDYLGISISE